MPPFYSQHQEDRWLVEHLELPEKGVFVEVGAYDGIELSNTYHFEQKGWTGLCIEADPRQWHKLLFNRACYKFLGAAGESGNVAFDMMEIPSHSGVGRGGKTVIVPSLPLFDLISSYPMSPAIDLLSLDTEGTELAVWASGYFGGMLPYPRIIVIEHDTAGLPSAREAILNRFAMLPYGLVHETAGNLIFERTKQLPEGE